MRKHFIFTRANATPLIELEVLEMTIGELHTKRYSLDDTLIYIKTNENDFNNFVVKYPNYELFLEEKTELEIQNICSTIEWQLNEIF